jgi:hypothetical protein
MRLETTYGSHENCIKIINRQRIKWIYKRNGRMRVVDVKNNEMPK